jgi:hypothetical protein
VSIRKSLLLASFSSMVLLFCPFLALSQSQVFSLSLPTTGKLSGTSPISWQRCDKQNSFVRTFRSDDAVERYSRDERSGAGQACEAFPLDGPPRELLSRGTAPAMVKPSIFRNNDLHLGSPGIGVSSPEELKDIGEEGTTIARVRQATLEILEGENNCSAWFRHFDPDVSATFRSLDFSVDEDGPDRVIKERNDRGAWIEHGPYIARTRQNAGPGATVTINANGAFFRRKDEIYKVNWLGAAEWQTGTWRYLRVGPYDGGTLQAQVIAALHELAHVINAIPWDDSTRVGFYRSQENTELVLRYCRSEITGSPKRLRLVMTQSSAN